MRASEIAKLVDGALEGEGGADPEVTGVAPLDRAGPRDLALVSHPRYLSDLETTDAGALLVADRFAQRPGVDTRPRIVVRDAHRALAILLPRLYPSAAPMPGVHATAILELGVELGEEVRVGPYAVIEAGARIGARARIGAHGVVGAGCEIGEDVVLHPHVTLYAGTRVGARSILHSGVRAGVDGFGYAFDAGGHQKVQQVGRCVIGQDVEIGANSTIDRGSIGATEIGDGVKIDNLVHIAHNVRIGAHSIIVAQVGIAGSTRIGRGVTLGGQVGIPGHVTIGDGATLGAQAGVFGDIPPGETYSGYPARPHKEALRALGALARVPQLQERILELERALKQRGTAR